MDRTHNSTRWLPQAHQFIINHISLLVAKIGYINIPFKISIFGFDSQSEMLRSLYTKKPLLFGTCLKPSQPQPDFWWYFFLFWKNDVFFPIDQVFSMLDRVQTFDHLYPKANQCLVPWSRLNSSQIINWFV